VEQLTATGLFTKTYQAPYAYEVTLTSKVNTFALEKALVKKGYLIGYPLSDKQLVMYGSETKTKEDIDAFVGAIKEVQHDLH
jgi:hypothetical protein